MFAGSGAAQYVVVGENERVKEKVGQDRRTYKFCQIRRRRSQKSRWVGRRGRLAKGLPGHAQPGDALASPCEHRL